MYEPLLKSLAHDEEMFASCVCLCGGARGRGMPYRTWPTDIAERWGLALRHALERLKNGR